MIKNDKNEAGRGAGSREQQEACETGERLRKMRKAGRMKATSDKKDEEKTRLRIVGEIWEKHFSRKKRSFRSFRMIRGSVSATQ